MHERIVQAPPAEDTAPPASENASTGDDETIPPDDRPPPDRSVTGTWEKVDVTTDQGGALVNFQSVFVRGPSDVYVTEGTEALGTGYYHYDGKRWTEVRYPHMATELFGLPTGELVAFGPTVRKKSKSGDAWEPFSQPTDYALLDAHSLWGTSSKNLYASADRGNLHFDGSTWTLVPVINSTSWDLAGEFAGTSKDDVWFSQRVQGNQLFHFDGTKWSNVTSSLPVDVRLTPIMGPVGLFAVAPDDVWALGGYRTLLHFDGSKWSFVPGPMPDTSGDTWDCVPTRIWATSKKNAWLVGTHGSVFHWDGAEWSKVPSGITDDIYAIHGSDPEHVWIAPSNQERVLRLKPE